MMIRFSVKSDIKQIVNLWNEAFGDSEDEIMFFINNRYLPNNTLVCEIDGEIASLLFLLEGNMCIKNKDYPSYYLYAACTAKKYRGRGIMASMLRFAQKTAQNRGYSFICLMPGENSLFDFYEKHGYKTVFKKKLITVNRTSLSDHPASFNFSSDNSSINLSEIRNEALYGIDYFKWDDKAIEFAFNHNKMYGGEILNSCEGYLLYTQNNGILAVKETTFTSSQLKECLIFLAQKHNNEEIIVNVPVSCECEIGSAKIVPAAMMLALNDETEKMINQIDGAYLGLTLD